jgi:hypothetical protein
MTTTAVISIAAGLLLGGVGCLIPLGFRLGDRPEEAWLPDPEPRAEPRGAQVTVFNPGDAPVLVGLSLRPRGLRVRLEGGSYVSSRSRSTTPDVLATTQGSVGVVAPGASETMMVTADTHLGAKAELVATIGQRQRLKVIHRQLTLTPRRQTGPEDRGRDARSAGRTS